MGVSLSIVIPVVNEEQNIKPLYNKILDTLSTINTTYEVLFIDDGSTDGTYHEIRTIDDKNVRPIRFQKNYGKAAALSCGFSEAKGDFIVTMDGDQQDDPKEIPRFIQALEKYDMVSGWKSHRNDPLSKTLPSKIFNHLTKWITGIDIHDFNCGYKAYHSYVTKNINIYGEMHRYIPVIAYWKGFSVGEIDVEHHPRAHGKSKYGVKRLVKGVLDLLTVKFLMSYSKRPLHFFGSMGFMVSTIGGIICLYLLYIWVNGTSIGQRPLLTLGILLIFIGIQFISIGLIGELLVNSRNNKEWIIRDQGWQDDNSRLEENR